MNRATVCYGNIVASHSCTAEALRSIAKHMSCTFCSLIWNYIQLLNSPLGVGGALQRTQYYS